MEPERRNRRLSDKLLAAFHAACDANEVEIAERILVIAEETLKSEAISHPGNRQREMHSLVAGYERLWNLRKTNVRPIDSIRGGNFFLP